MCEILNNLPFGKRFCLTWIASFVAVGLFPNLAGAQDADRGFTTLFSSPPFKEGETVSGIDGWVAVSETEKKPETAAVESLLNGDGKMGLIIRSYGIDKKVTEKLSDRVRVTATFNVTDFGIGRLLIQPIMGGRVDIISFGYQSEANASNPQEAGIVYVAQPFDETIAPIRQLLVSRSDLAEGQPYLVTLDIDFGSQTFAISVAGKRTDGTPLLASASDISFQGKWNARSLTGLRIAGGGTPQATRVLLESVSVNPLF